MLKYLLFGEMAEWFKAPVLKTGVGQLTVGSNPSLSAEIKNPMLLHRVFCICGISFFGV